MESTEKRNTHLPKWFIDVILQPNYANQFHTLPISTLSTSPTSIKSTLMSITSSNMQSNCLSSGDSDSTIQVMLAQILKRNEDLQMKVDSH